MNESDDYQVMIKINIMLTKSSQFNKVDSHSILSILLTQ